MDAITMAMIMAFRTTRVEQLKASGGASDVDKFLKIGSDGKVTVVDLTIPEIDDTLTLPGKAADAHATGEAIEEVKGDLDTLSTVTLNAFPTATASGAVASFTDGAELPVKDMIVNIAAVQDLHGQSNPYPAGGGKNLFNIEDLTLTSSTFQNGVLSDTALNFASAYTESNPFSINLSAPVTISLKGKHEGTNSDTRGLTLKVLYSDETTGTAVYFSNGEGSVDYAALTFTSSKDIIGLYFDYGSVGGNVWYLKEFQIEAGSTATDYAPYENICPITGWTGVNVVRTGKNLIDESKLLLASGWTVTDGVYSGVNKQLHVAFADGFPNLKFEEDTQYCVSFEFQSATENKATTAFFEYTNGTKKTWYISGTTEQHITLISDSSKSIETFGLSYGSSDTIYISKLQIEEGSSATDYEAYAEQTISVDWTSEAGTVYGGSLDVTTGVLTVTHGNIASYDGETLPGEWISDRDVYAEGTTPTTGAQVVYALATPTTIQLTPQEVTTLLGDNTIYADTGDVSVEYRADPTLYINRKIAEAISALS